MTLLIKFSGFGSYSKQIIVEWNQDLDNFPKFSKYDGRYFGWSLYDRDDSGQADQMLLLAEHTRAALPVNIQGSPWAIADLETMFGLVTLPAGKCECGTDKAGGGIHSSWCPKGA